MNRVLGISSTIHRLKPQITGWQLQLAILAAFLSALFLEVPILAQPTTPSIHTDNSPISSDEPYASEYSLDQAYAYLDSAATAWSKSHRCITCHTNGLYLISGRQDSDTLLATRQFAREYLKRFLVNGEDPHGQHGSVTGVIASTALLAISEARTEGELDPMTRQAFDYIWTLQNENGHWSEWLKCNWPPFEVDDHFAATLVAVAVGRAPDGYSETPAAKLGINRLRSYLSNNPPTNMHQSAMLLWASTSMGGILTRAQQQSIIEDLFALQKPDGGWNLITLGAAMKAIDDDAPEWLRTDGKSQDMETSDGYATGFVIYVLRQSGVDASDERIKRGIGWLKTHQRASGRWFTRSPRVDNRHFISNAGTSFAVLALHACGD